MFGEAAGSSGVNGVGKIMATWTPSGSSCFIVGYVSSNGNFLSWVGWEWSGHAL